MRSSIRRSPSGQVLVWLLTPSLVFLAVFSAEAQGNGGREEAFDQVWERINSDFYDESFGGHDWAAIGRRYRDKAVNAETEEDFYIAMNTMLFELKVSHIGLIPNKHPEWFGAPATFANGEVGLDIRIIDDNIVVVRRKARLRDAPAIQPGTVITSLNGLTLDDLAAEALEPPVPAIPPLMLTAERASRELFRDAGESVEITYLNEKGVEAAAALTAYAREGAVEMLEGIPPVYLEFESHAVDDKTGYVRFNSFHPELTDRILDAINEFRGLSGLVIDLRGNSGGDFQVRRAIAEHLITERALVWRYVNRFGTTDIVLDPAPNAYRGKVVFLVDEMSASSAEELSGAMQALGRAKVVGKRTPGLVLVAAVQPIDIDATLVYPSAETRFANDVVPEGKGITPDVAVPYDVQSLRAGRDIQLETAVGLLRQ